MSRCFGAAKLQEPFTSPSDVPVMDECEKVMHVPLGDQHVVYEGGSWLQSSDKA